MCKWPSFSDYEAVLFYPQVLSLHLIVRSALSVNEIQILFQKNSNLKPSPNDIVSERRLGLHIWPEIAYLAKLISDIFQSVNRGHDHRNRIWNKPICLVILSVYIRHQIQTGENGGSLDFNFISLPSPAVDENWGLPAYCLLHSLSSKNNATYSWNVLWTANSLKVSFFSCLCVCVHS